MFVLAHIGITVGVVYLAYHLWNREKLATLDLRWLALGAMLPDIIDKTLGMVLMPEVFGHGRLYFHSITVAMMVTLVTLSTRRESVYLVGVGVWFHLFLDSMWQDERTFLWPILGWKLPPGHYEMSMWLDTLFHNHLIQTTEVLGLVVLLAVGYRHGMLSWSEIKGFFSSGRLKRREQREPQGGSKN